MGIIVKPVFTEKAVNFAELHNLHTFRVCASANKLQIKDAIERFYGVSVTAVRTVNVAPKHRTKFTKTGVQHGRVSAYKKALVQLAEGSTLDVHENS